MDSITKKNAFIGQRKDHLNEKVDKRLGLELDNQGLRDEISALQTRLHKCRDENNSKDKRTSALKQSQTDEKKEHMRLTSTIEKAKHGQKLQKDYTHLKLNFNPCITFKNNFAISFVYFNKQWPMQKSVSKMHLHRKNFKELFLRINTFSLNKFV